MRVLSEVARTDKYNVIFAYELPDVNVYVDPLYNAFEDYVARKFKKKFTPIQEYWARKVFTLGDSILNAFTGYGKTTFLLWLSLFLSEQGYNVLYVTGNENMKREILERLKGLGYERPPFDLFNVMGRHEKDNLARLVFEERREWDYVIADDVDSVLSYFATNTQVIVLQATLKASERARSLEEAMKEVIEWHKLGKRYLFTLSKYLSAKTKKDEEGKEKVKSDWYDELLKIYNEINTLREKKRARLLVASATPFSSSPQLFALSGIHGGVSKGVMTPPSIEHYILIDDFDNVIEDLVKIVRRGTFVFITSAFVRKLIEECERYDLCERLNKVKSYETKKKYVFDYVASLLERKGLKVRNVERLTQKALKELLKEVKEGKYDVFIASISGMGRLVRGIESKEFLKYVVFVGFPTNSMVLSSNVDEVVNFIVNEGIMYANDTFLRLALDLQSEEVKRAWEEVRPFAVYVIEKLNKIGNVENAVEVVKELALEDHKVKEFLEKVEAFVKALREAGKEEIKIDVPHVKPYFQASGRLGRIIKTEGRYIYMTKGIAITIEWRRSIQDYLETRFVDFAKFYVKDVDSLVKDLEAKEKEIEASKKEGYKVEVDVKGLIVESPRKISTIGRMFGPAVKYTINWKNVVEVATGKGLLVLFGTGGHFLRPKLEEGIKACCNDYVMYGVTFIDGATKTLRVTYVPIGFCPKEGKELKRCNDERPILPFFSNEETVRTLYTLASLLDYFVIMTDNDEEGEKIGYDAMVIIKHVNPSALVYRGVFSALVKDEVERAIESREGIRTNVLLARTLREVDDVVFGVGVSQVTTVATFLGSLLFPTLIGRKFLKGI